MAEGTSSRDSDDESAPPVLGKVLTAVHSQAAASLVLPRNGATYWTVGSQLLVLPREFFLALSAHPMPCQKGPVPSGTVSSYPQHWQALGVPKAAHLCIVSEELLAACQQAVTIVRVPVAF